jgi:RNA polymerase sigma-70 factor (ECF subfamily)
MPPHDSEQARWFSEQVLPHEADLRGWLQARFPVLTDVDDVVQESYQRLLRVQATGPIANARAFLFVSARNVAFNQLRRLRRERRDPWAEDAIATLEKLAALGARAGRKLGGPDHRPRRDLTGLRPGESLSS